MRPGRAAPAAGRRARAGRATPRGTGGAARRGARRGATHGPAWRAGGGAHGAAWRAGRRCAGTKKAAPRSGLKSAPVARRLPAVVREGLVGLRHAEDVVLALVSAALLGLGVQELVGQALRHGLLAAVARELDEPADGERAGARRGHLDRDLVRGGPDPAGGGPQDPGGGPVARGG